MTITLDEEKAALRKIAGARRKAAAAASPQAATALQRQFEAVPRPVASSAVSGYWPIGSEIDPRPLLEDFVAAGLEVGLPVVLGPGQPLQFRRWRPGEALEAAGFGLQEPSAASPALTPRLLLVPLLAFDRAGYRLGYGGGFYDRTLARLRPADPQCLAVGLAYAAQEVEAVPREATDLALDWIVTEREAIEISDSCASSSAAIS